MLKYDKISKICFILTAIYCTIASGSVVFAAQELGRAATSTTVTTADGNIVVTPAPSSVLAPQGLSDQEQAQLEQQYKFQFKNKGSILSPFISSAGAGVDIEQVTKAQSEREKMYRYFGAAMGLYEKGRLDEAIEILKYITEKRPDDEYAKSYLKKLITERQFKKNQWSTTAKSDATFLKRDKIKNLLMDGKDYYKQKDFDKALLKFSDVLELDPGNKDAKRYINRLKEYYLKEVKVEGIVDDYESSSEAGEKAPDNEGSADSLSDKMLDEKERNMETAATKLMDKEENEINKKAETLLSKKEDKISAASENLLNKKEDEAVKKADEMLNDEEMASLIGQKRMGSFLDQAELGLTVEDIIAKKKEEERKALLYTLGPGDAIMISVRDHPELSGNAIVRLGGEVVLPLVNDVVQVKGLTVEEATEKIKAAMKRYVKDPFVTVTISDYNSKKYYVIDENGATPYPITRANLTLRDALFIADWGNGRALGRVIVMKPNDLHPIIRKVDAFDIIYRGNLAKNVRIEDGDVIYVPMTIAAKTTKTINDTLAPFVAVRSLRDEWLNQKGDEKSWKELWKIRTDLHEQGYEDMLWGPSGISSSSTTLTSSI